MSVSRTTVLIKRKRDEDPLDSLCEYPCFWRYVNIKTDALVDVQVGTRPLKRPYAEGVLRRVVQQNEIEVDRTQPASSHGSGFAKPPVISVGPVVPKIRETTKSESTGSSMQPPSSLLAANIPRFHLKRPSQEEEEEDTSGGLAKTKRVKKNGATFFAEEIQSEKLFVSSTQDGHSQPSVEKGTRGLGEQTRPKQGLDPLKDHRAPEKVQDASVLGLDSKDAGKELGSVENGSSGFGNVPLSHREFLVDFLRSEEERNDEIPSQTSSSTRNEQTQSSSEERISEDTDMVQGLSNLQLAASDDFVYDTFVLEPQLPKDAAELQKGRVGVLAIGDEDQEYWLEGQVMEGEGLSEDEYDDDEEDENGEWSTSRGCFLVLPRLC